MPKRRLSVILHPFKSKINSSPASRYRSSFDSVAAMNPPLVRFYSGTGVDHRGRSLNDILQWPASRLESSHDYIQTLFPLPEESAAQWDAPLIDRQVFDAFRYRRALRDKLRDSFKKMLWFYGFELKMEEDAIKIVRGPTYPTNSQHWDVKSDHNHLRITRIIRCLRILGLEQEAQAFHLALEENTQRVSSRSREYWRRAAQRPLNIRPDLKVEEDEDVGPKFLREYEQELRAEKAKAEREASERQAAETEAGKEEAKEDSTEEKHDEH